MERIVIIGAGIAGLFTAYNLLKKNKYEIIIIEKENEIGGRLYTQQVNIDNHTFYLEGGAGVFRDDDKNVVKLLNELNISYNLWKSNTDVIYSKDNENQILNNDYEKVIYNLCKYKQNNKSFIDILQNNNNLEDIEKIAVLIGTTYTELFNANSKNVCNNNDFFEFLYSNKHQFGKPKAWNELPQYLEKEILALGGKIITNTSVVEINKNFVKTNNSSKFKYDKLIVTCPYHYFIKIKLNIDLNLWKQNIESYHEEIDYLRVYSYFKEPLILKNKIATNLSIRRVIPLSDKMIMTIYTDGFDATHINKLCKNKNKLDNLIKAELKTLLHHDIPSIEKNWCFFWKKGISYWKPSDISVKEIIKKIRNPISNIYFCGDTYSEFPGWIESAIKSCNFIIKKL
jgi:hypothetical protein